MVDHPNQQRPAIAAPNHDLASGLLREALPLLTAGNCGAFDPDRCSRVHCRPDRDRCGGIAEDQQEHRPVLQPLLLQSAYHLLRSGYSNRRPALASPAMRIASRCTDEELVVPVGSQGRRNAFLDCDSAPLDGLARNCPGPAARRIVVEEENDLPNRARNGNPAKLFASK